MTLRRTDLAAIRALIARELPPAPAPCPAVIVGDDGAIAGRCYVPVIPGRDHGHVFLPDLEDDGGASAADLHDRADAAIADDDCSNERT